MRSIVTVRCDVCKHADIRAQLNADDTCLAAIRELERHSDAMLSKHAAIAKAAVLWMP
jgi:hypothetical protein